MERTIRKPLSSEIVAAAAVGTPLMQCSGSEAFEAAGLYPYGGDRLLLPVAEEYTPLGSFLLRHLWSEEPVNLWFRQAGARAVCLIRRNYIVGPVFSHALAKVRAEDPAADMTCVYELTPLSFERTEVPELTIKEAGRAQEPEIHMDNPALH